MAYAPGAYTQELLQQHNRDEHVDEFDENCPSCQADRDKQDPDVTAEAIMEMALDFDEATAAHATHRFDNAPGNCLTCAARAGERA